MKTSGDHSLPEFPGYDVLEVIGEGGMGTVYLATDLRHDRRVAIKTIREAFVNPDVVRRFEREILLTSSLQHPRILPLLDSGVADGALYYVMQFIEGESLETRLAREGQLPIDEALRIARQVADALEYAHSRDVVHRDIKPANIMLSGRHALVMDFGIARAVVEGTQSLTYTGAAIGTPKYMSPEQAADSSSVDGRSDLYALGCVLFEMIAGQPPFTGSSVDSILRQHLAADPPSLALLRPLATSELESLVHRALAKSPADRFQTASALGEELERIGRGHAPPLDVGRRLRHGVRSLLDRRVPQILGVYFASAYGIVEFVDLLVDRYVWSPHLVTLVLFLFALLIPSVALLAWHHGRPGRDEWTRAERIGIPANLAVAIGVLGLAFGGEELGAATTMVSVEDEDGNLIEAAVPKIDFRRRLAVFYFENEADGEDSDWLSYAVPEALQTDLDQDPFVSTAIGFVESLKQKGFEDARGASIPLLRETAGESLRDHFLTGTVLSADDGVAIRTSLYETRSGKLVAEHTFSGADVFDTIDSLSVRIKRDLEIPGGHLETVRDLPVRELYADSEDAFRDYALGHMALEVREDYPGAIRSLEAAVERDPTFALANWELSRVYTSQNRGIESEAALQAAMDHLYRLPQRYQFRVKQNYYQRREEPDKALAVAEMRVELHPDDVEAYEALATLYLRRDRPDDALAMYERLLEVNPSDLHPFDHIGDVHRDEGRFEEALTAYREYAGAYPERSAAVRKIAALFQRSGDRDSARAYYERASVMEPDDLSLALDIANLEFVAGEFEAAARRLDEAETRVRTPDQTRVLRGTRVGHLAFRGEVRAALRELGELHEELSEVTTLLGLYADSLILAVPLMASLGDTASALGVLARFAGQAQPPLDDFVELAYLDLYRPLEDADEVEARIPAAQAFIDAMGYEAGQYVVDLMRAEIHRWRGECGAALPLYEAVLETSPERIQEVEAGILMAKCLRGTGDMEAARGALDAALAQMPAHPAALLELARLEAAAGEREAANEALDRALGVLQDADPEFRLAREARDLAAELRG